MTADDPMPIWLVIVLVSGSLVLLRGVWLSVARREMHRSIYGWAWAKSPIVLRWYHWPYLVLIALLAVGGLVILAWWPVGRFGT
jgi:hypothetical protein